MEKYFVPNEESLELKKLGFDEPCFGKWLSSAQSNWKNYELILEMGMNEEFEDNRNIYLLEGACSAPTFSQCFRWFREKYNIWCWNEKYTEDETYIYQIPKFNFKKIQGYYKSYEEAELACLK